MKPGTDDGEVLEYTGTDYANRAPEDEHGPSFVRLGYQVPTDEQTGDLDSETNGLNVENAHIVGVAPTKLR